MILFLLLAAALAGAQQQQQSVCQLRYNAGPSGENRNCPLSTPYCVQASALTTAFCSVCNPELQYSICDCAAGQFCDSDRSSGTYGTCIDYPLFGQTRGSIANCLTTYVDSNGNKYDSVQLQCVLGYCRACNYILQNQPLTCSNGTKNGDTLTCSKATGNWVLSGSVPTAKPASDASGITYSLLLLLLLLLLLAIVYGSVRCSLLTTLTCV